MDRTHRSELQKGNALGRYDRNNQRERADVVEALMEWAAKCASPDQKISFFTGDAASLSARQLAREAADGTHRGVSFVDFLFVQANALDIPPRAFVHNMIDAETDPPVGHAA